MAVDMCKTVSDVRMKADRVANMGTHIPVSRQCTWMSVSDALICGTIDRHT